VGVRIDQAGQKVTARQVLGAQDRPVMQRSRRIDPPQTGFLPIRKLDAMNGPRRHAVTVTTCAAGQQLSQDVPPTGRSAKDAPHRTTLNAASPRQEAPRERSRHQL
jgi:hypothetical protein